MKVKLKKMIWIIAGIIAIATLIQISFVIGIEYCQYNKNEKRLSSFNLNQQRSKTLVIYFSRSGNTELMAYQIAELKKATIMNVIADDYKIGFKGWVNAMIDARKTKGTVNIEKVDLSAYDTIYIGSPIWLYSPAPPVFEFVRKNDLTGKKVILFNSMNSKFDQKYIDQFSAMVGENGGQLIRHIYVIRGRMTQQMDIKEFLSDVRGKVGS